MKILLGQINTTPGDFKGNYKQIKTGVNKAIENNCTMAIFPELSIPGYLTCDKMFQTNYLKRNQKYLYKLVEYSKKCDVYIVVGYIGKNTKGVGKHFTNMLAVIQNGMVVGTYQKQLLPFYDVFSEGRWFEPGDQNLILNIEDKNVGFTICEDIWNDKNQDDYNYSNNPIKGYNDLDIDIIVNISSSPFIQGKPHKRKKMLSKVCQRNKHIIYVNQIGGQDELVFDGKSSIYYDGYMKYCVISTKNEPSYECVDIKTNYGYQHVENKYELFNNLVIGLKDYITKTGFKNVVIGSSGGIDSAVVIALASEAIGAENVNAIMMPSKFSSEGSVNDAKLLHKNIGCNEFLVPINHLDLLTDINEKLGLFEYNKVANENIQARIRGQIIMHHSNATGSLPLTTGNKTENAVGYFTLYGDSCGGFAVIKDLYKLEVYELAKSFNEMKGYDVIPLNIIDKAPSAELDEDQVDENSLLPYSILDYIVKGFIEEYIDSFYTFKNWITPLYNNKRHLNENKYDNVFKWCNNEGNKDEYKRIIRLININEFKRRQTAPGIKVSKVAFGTGRIMPIVCKI